jgi:hypothetical protein
MVILIVESLPKNDIYGYLIFIDIASEIKAKPFN